MKVRSIALAVSILTGTLGCFAQFPAQNLPLSEINNTVPNARITSQLSGTVLGGTGDALNNAKIELRDVGTGMVVASGYTDQLGQFNFENIENGRYEIVALSGISETRERVDIQGATPPLTLRFATTPEQRAAKNSGPTVSVTNYLIPDKARKEFERAQKAYSENKFDKAREHSEKALTIAPEYAEALTMLGLLDLNDEHVDAAVEHLQRAIDADPGYPLAYTVMGAALNGERQYQQALATLERGLAINPNAWQAYFEMARASLGLSDFVSALKNARRAAAINEKYPPIQLAQAHALLGLKRYNEAATLYEQYLSEAPPGPDSQNARKALNRARSFAMQAAQ